MAGQREVLRNRVMLAANWVAVVAALAFTAIQIGTTAHRTVDTYAALAVLGLGAAASSLRATRMRIELSDTGLDNYKLFRTEHVAWQDVVAVAVDYYGLHIGLADGRVVTAGSMGRPNWASWFKIEEVAADRWVRRIEARALGARQAS